MRKVVVVGGVRIPFMKSFTGYAKDSNQNLMTRALRGLVDRFGLEGEKVDEVALGSVMKFPDDWNLARESALGSGLHPTTPAYDLQRACGTGLEAAIQIADKIAVGAIDVGIAGGTDTNSDFPVLFPKSFGQKLMGLRGARSTGQRLGAMLGFGLKDVKPVFPGITEPRTGKSMGEHCEMMAKEWKISREEQDLLAYESHQKGAAAYKAGFYSDLIVEHRGLTQDGILRPDTTLEKLATLKPAFDRTSGQGTLTAGNSTALTDGASCVLLCSEEHAEKMGWEPLAVFRAGHTAAVDFVAGEGLLMAPTVAVSELLERLDLSLQDFDLYEIHEAFAAQVLCTLKAWESDEYSKKRLGRDKALGPIDRSKMNIQGGSVAMGHPFAATGGRVLATLAKSMKEHGSERGLISICTGGGMGVVAVLEKV